MYNERMNSYYPQVIQSILEFKSIIDSESPEFESLAEGRDKTLQNTYLVTMDEDRIAQWEQMLHIQPIEGSSVNDRRDTVIARIRGQGKLNTSLISSIVNAFTGGTANSWVEDSVLYVEITPPPNNKEYLFENVKQEIVKKIPAHLGLSISRNYFTWENIKTTYSTWQNIKDEFADWEEVLLFVPFQ